MPKAEIEEKHEVEEKKLNGLSMDPKSVIVLLWAILLDFLGVISFFLSFLLVGIILSFIIDALAITTLGWWGWKRSGKMAQTKSSKKVLKKFLKRFGAASAIELVPFLGDIVTSWTIYVFLELKNADKE